MPYVLTMYGGVMYSTCEVEKKGVILNNYGALSLGRVDECVCVCLPQLSLCCF